MTIHLSPSYLALADFQVIMGMNKIFLGLERYNLTSSLLVWAAANELVMRQSVEEVMTVLPTETVKFLAIKGGATELYPCNSGDFNIIFAHSGEVNSNARQ